MLPNKPDFFIVGAPKCGTTALFSYLAQHPEVFTPCARKELNFFSSDLTVGNDQGYCRCSNLQEYLGLFSARAHEKRAGEGSVWYLYSRVAAHNIYSFNPGSRIIIMLRNPVDMMYSLYYENLVNGLENLLSFEAALLAEQERKQNGFIPRTGRELYPLEGVYYTEIASFSRQIRRYLDIFPGERVKIVIYDDFAADPKATYTSVLEFLEVTHSFEPTFEVLNANRVIRSVRLWRWMKFSPPALRRIWRAVVPHPLRAQVLRRVHKANMRVSSRPALGGDIRAKLQRDMASEVEQLSQLLDRDLMSWVRM